MLAYLQLLRLPTVFTAMADIVLGFVLTHHYLYGPQGTQPGVFPQVIGWNRPGDFVGLLLASCCLYLSGMVFNDIFDRQQDAVERPLRPIPSGRVPLRTATIMGTILMLSGVVSAASVGLVSLCVAVLLVAAILGYDSVLKRTPLGPLAMGSCRFLNVMLGASAGSDGMASLCTQPQFAAATGLGLFIVGVTLFARTEASISSRWQLAVAQIVMNGGIGILAWLVWSLKIHSPTQVPLAMLVVIAFTINRRSIEALRDPSPVTVQGSIKVMLLSLVMLDATLVYWYLNTPGAGGYGAMHALATSVLVIPAMLLSRLIPMT